MTLHQEKILHHLLNNHNLEAIGNARIDQIESSVGYRITNNTYRLIQDKVDKIILDSYIPRVLVSLLESKLDQHSVREKIITAIKNRWYLAVYYEDDEGHKGFRLIEPYVIGRGFRMRGVVSENHKKDYYVRCYVIKDAKLDKSVFFKRNPSYSYSEETPYWRIFRMDRILSIVVIKKKIRWYRSQYTGGTDSNIVQRLEWANIKDFNGVNPHEQ